MFFCLQKFGCVIVTCGYVIVKSAYYSFFHGIKMCLNSEETDKTYSISILVYTTFLDRQHPA